MAPPGNATTTSTPDLEAMHEVAVPARRVVSYRFEFTTQPSLRLPYALAVDGVTVRPVAGAGPGRIANGKRVSVTVNAGQAVTLYLNSDAHEAFRREPVYRVVAGERDALVVVVEQRGRSNATDAPVAVGTITEGGATIDHYTAVLTGDIWMRVSHRYSEAEAGALLPADADPGLRAAVLAIFRGLPADSVTATCATGRGGGTTTITATFRSSMDASDNITAYSLLADGMPRGHPRGYLAIFAAARAAGLSAIELSSVWRPTLGSIAHRCGLGFDVTVLAAGAERFGLNRQELRRGQPELPWVSAEERRLFGEYEAAVTARKQEAAAVERAAQARDAVAGDPVRALAAEQALAAAKQRETEAGLREREAEAAWNAERDANEPASVRAFRDALRADESVRQIFDPWFMDDDARDQKAPKPNRQASSNEKLHAHHLHVTVIDAGILA